MNSHPQRGAEFDLSAPLCDRLDRVPKTKSASPLASAFKNLRFRAPEANHVASLAKKVRVAAAHPPTFI